MRLFHTKTLNKQVKNENALHKEYAMPFNQAREIMDTKMLAYYRKQQEKIDAENERVRKEAEKLAKKEKLPVEEVVASVDTKEVAKTVGTATVKKRKTFRVIDKTKVAYEYLMVDEVRVMGAIRNNVTDIKGIEIYEEEIMSTR